MWHPLRSFFVLARRLILPSVPRIYDLIARLNEPGQTVVAAPGTALGARIAQEKLGVPLATVHLQPIMLRSTLEPGCFGFPDIIGHLPRPLRSAYLRAVDRFLIDRLLAPGYKRVSRRTRAAPVRRLFDRWFHSPSSSSDFSRNGSRRPLPTGPPMFVSMAFHSGTKETCGNVLPRRKSSSMPAMHQSSSLRARLWSRAESSSGFRRKSAAPGGGEVCF